MQIDDSNSYLNEWINWAFSNYSGGKQMLTRHGMKMAVICLTGKKPSLTKQQNSFSIQDLKDIVGHLKKEAIFCDMNGIYDEIDREGKGFVSIEDLKEAARKNGATVQMKTIEEAFNAADSDKDGRISYKDFLSYVKSGMIELGII